MANREENLKKINAELEKLSDEEIEKVAGGYSDFVPDNNPEDSEKLKKLLQQLDLEPLDQEIKKNPGTFIKK